MTIPPVIKRNTPSFALKVTRPAFSDMSSPADWSIKLVKSYFDCSKTTDLKLPFDPADKTMPAPSGPPPGSPPDEVTFPGVGLYKVCFAKDGLNYEQIPSAAGDVHLEID